jgi:hypothetical protein
MYREDNLTQTFTRPEVVRKKTKTVKLKPIDLLDGVEPGIYTVFEGGIESESGVGQLSSSGDRE